MSLVTANPPFPRLVSEREGEAHPDRPEWGIPRLQIVEGVPVLRGQPLEPGAPRQGDSGKHLVAGDLRPEFLGLPADLRALELGSVPEGDFHRPLFGILPR